MFKGAFKYLGRAMAIGAIEHMAKKGYLRQVEASLLAVADRLQESSVISASRVLQGFAADLGSFTIHTTPPAADSRVLENSLSRKPTESARRDNRNGSDPEVRGEKENNISFIRQYDLWNYIQNMDSVAGWLSIMTCAAIAETLWLQEKEGITGNVAEIGIHHGKSFLAIAAGMAKNDLAFAIDIFENQNLNVDYSGHGDKELFLENVRRFFPNTNLEIITSSSTEMRGKEHQYGMSDIRFFSIDGGHTSYLTNNDLEIADNVLISAGICVLDDILSSNWTGVITGLFRFLDKGRNLTPFAMFPNKLFLCRPEYIEFFKKKFRETFDFAIDKIDVELHNGVVDVYADNWPDLPALLERYAASERKSDR